MKTILSPNKVLISITLLIASVTFPYESVASATIAPANTQMGVATAKEKRFTSAVEFVNELRAQNGRAPLSLDSRLQTYAQLRAQKMADEGLFSHTDMAGGNFYTMMIRDNAAPDVACENLSISYSNDAETPVYGWKKSAEHKACMLDEQMSHIGFAQVYFDTHNSRARYVAVMIAGSN